MSLQRHIQTPPTTPQFHTTQERSTCQSLPVETVEKTPGLEETTTIEGKETVEVQDTIKTRTPGHNPSGTSHNTGINRSIHTTATETHTERGRLISTLGGWSVSTAEGAATVLTTAVLRLLKRDGNKI